MMSVYLLTLSDDHPAGLVSHSAGRLLSTPLEMKHVVVVCERRWLRGTVDE